MTQRSYQKSFALSRCLFLVLTFFPWRSQILRFVNFSFFAYNVTKNPGGIVNFFYKLTARVNKRSQTTLIIMVIVGHDQVIIFCINILPLAFLDCTIFSFFTLLGCFWRSSDLSGGILLICGPPGENKNNSLIRLVMENVFHYFITVI